SRDPWQWRNERVTQYHEVHRGRVHGAGHRAGPAPRVADAPPATGPHKQGLANPRTGRWRGLAGPVPCPWRCRNRGGTEGRRQGYPGTGGVATGTGWGWAGGPCLEAERLGLDRTHSATRGGSIMTAVEAMIYCLGDAEWGHDNE